MHQLIAIGQTAISNEAIPTCNARDLHQFLESKAQFADWIKDRIEQYGFEEGKDYVEVFQKITKNPQGGRPAKEYALSLDMAKELSMVERTEKGKQARQYFIECERQAKAGHPLKSLPPAKQAIESIKAFNALFEWQQKRLHLDANAANIRANQAVHKLCGVDLLALTGNTHLVAENQASKPYTSTELGMRIGGLSGQKVNQLLAAAGLQSKPAKDWLPTAQGEGHFVWHDTGKRHGSGSPVAQLKWYSSVLPLIEPLIQQREAA